jgi:hypothetical protein
MNLMSQISPLNLTDDLGSMAMSAYYYGKIEEKLYQLTEWRRVYSSLYVI